MHLIPTPDIPRVVRAGKVRGNLAQEYQLERCVHNLTQRHQSWTSETPACMWYGVSCRHGDVYVIEWNHEKLRGILDFSALPVSAVGFQCKENHLTGPLSLVEFPPSLLELNVAVNQLSGGLDMGELWSKITFFEAQVNTMSGLLDFTQIPPDLWEMRLAWNGFYGNLDFTTYRIPRNLRVLDLSQNKFRGTLCLKGLWAPDLQLSVQGNSLIKHFDVRQVNIALLTVDRKMKLLDVPRFSPVVIKYVPRSKSRPTSRSISTDPHGLSKRTCMSVACLLYV